MVRQIAQDGQLSGRTRHKWRIVRIDKLVKSRELAQAFSADAPLNEKVPADRDAVTGYQVVKTMMPRTSSPGSEASFACS